MSDHAAVIRELLLDMGNGDTSPEEYDAGLAALDRLEAQLADYENVSGEQYDYDTLLFKYGEKARDVREYQSYARDLRARAEAAEASLREIVLWDIILAAAPTKEEGT